MPKISAGLIMYRVRDRQLEVLLAHPGGPFWAGRDEGVWTIPKGEVDAAENPLATAVREFEEETGLKPHAPFIALGSIQQKSGKIVHAWAFRGDCDPATVRSNLFQLEWPPKSGRIQEFVEIDRAEFFDIASARTKIIPAQSPLLDSLAARVAEAPTTVPPSAGPGGM